MRTEVSPVPVADVAPGVSHVSHTRSSPFCPAVFTHAQAADAVEGEEDAIVEDPDAKAGEAVVGTDAGDEAEGVREGVKSHPDADTTFLITKPQGLGYDLPAGKDVSFLVGFSNKGKQDFTVHSLEASFRYAMDFSFHLQNFSAIQYNRLVRPDEEATFAYSFLVSEGYSSRPYGFTVNLNYKDAEGQEYTTAVFNQTVSIIELDEGLDGETFFLYVLMAALVVLMGFLVNHYFISSGKKRSYTPKVVETGTANGKDIDYDWIPESIRKSTRVSHVLFPVPL